MLRTHTCGDLKKLDLGKKVVISGWVQARRDHGGFIFIDLRDRYGITQVTFDPDKNGEVFSLADSLRSEFVVSVTGTVVARPDKMINDRMKTGEIEIVAEKLEIFSKAKTPIFEIESEAEEEKNVNEETRLKYRYLDMRRKRVKYNMITRHEAILFIRNFLAAKQFIEVETPILTKSTPEGARDYLVPSRLHKGQFYALPQSPQQYKQLLMVGGIDRYFQIARCLRDEDARGDRQAEFSQLDIEMSFVQRDDVLDLIEEMFTGLVDCLNQKGLINKKIKWVKWPRLSYEEVVLKYGLDKPDLRFDLEINDVSDLAKGSEFSVFAKAIEDGGVVRALKVPGVADSLTRSTIDELTELVKKYGAKGLAYIKVKQQGLDSPIIKFLGQELAQKIVDQVQGQIGDIIFFGADNKLVVQESLGQLRQALGHKLGLINDSELAFAFIVDFPLFEPSLENGHYAPMHHMFTMPKPEDISLLATNPAAVRSLQYDFVANGYEAGGGSIRIHDAKLQEKIFDLIGFDNEQKNHFKHILEAFNYGVPPHGGIAPGIDRLLMILLGEPNIREVMAFPKTGDGRDLLVSAPAEVKKSQLKDLGIKI